MLTVVRTNQFKKDVKKARKRGKDMVKLKTLLSLLMRQDPLPAAYQDHPLRGNWPELERMRIYFKSSSHFVRCYIHDAYVRAPQTVKARGRK